MEKMSIREILHLIDTKDLLTLSIYIRENKGDPTMFQDNGYSIMHPIMVRRNLCALETLIVCGLSMEMEYTSNLNFHTPLLKACTTGYLDGVKLLVDNGAHIEHSDKAGYTPFLTAIQRNNVDIARYLYESGANIYATTIHGDTALHCACNWNSNDSIAFLLSIGFDLQAQNNQGKTGFNVATSHGNKEGIKMIGKHMHVW